MDITKYNHDVSFFEHKCAFKKQQFGSSYIMENKVSKKQYLFNYVPFTLEVEKILQLFHPAILPVEGISLANDVHPFILINTLPTLECLECSLQSGIQELDVIFGIASAMNCAAKKGIYHGNLTLDSILLNQYKQPVIVGLGTKQLFRGKACEQCDLKAFATIIAQIHNKDSRKTEITEGCLPARIVKGIREGAITSFEQIIAEFEKVDSDYISGVRAFAIACEKQNDEYARWLYELKTPPAQDLANSIRRAVDYPTQAPLRCDPAPICSLNIAKLPSPGAYKNTGELRIKFGTAFTTENAVAVRAVMSPRLQAAIDVVHPCVAAPYAVELAAPGRPLTLFYPLSREVKADEHLGALVAAAYGLRALHNAGAAHGQFSLSFVRTEITPAVYGAGVAAALGFEATPEGDVRDFAIAFKDDAPEFLQPLFARALSKTEKTPTMCEFVAAIEANAHRFEEVSAVFINAFQEFDQRFPLARFGDEAMLTNLATLVRTLNPSPRVDEAVDALWGEEGDAALVKAAGDGDLKKVKRMLAAGVPAGALAGGRTALHAAAEGGYECVVRALLAAGAFVNAQNSEGATPLHVAASHGQRRVIEALTECPGIDFDALDRRGRTPRMAADDNHTRFAIRPRSFPWMLLETLLGSIARML